MASLILGIAGAAAGSAVFGSGLTLFGATLTGAQIGGMIGASLGGAADAALAPGRTLRRQGGRLGDVAITGSTEGAAIPAVFGHARIAGQLIWATRFREETRTTRVSRGGKGGGRTNVETTEYLYSISFAVGLCEGEIARVARIWADGKPLDLSQVTMRIHRGTEDQAPDPLIEQVEGAGNVPAYRGLAYVVFEWLPLAAFGNRIPQLAFEIIRPLTASDPEALENRIAAVNLIPGCGEFAYASETVFAEDGDGGSDAQNAHSAMGGPNLTVSLDALQDLAPNLKRVSLVAAWFGDDLRAGACRIAPRVETHAKATHPRDWSVNGIMRAAADSVSAVQDRPAYGGTPSDASIVQAIQLLKERGLGVTLYPFLLMDVPAANARPDPWSGSGAQSAYPGRGRITCNPAPGRAGSPDRTPAAAAEIAAFFGNAAAGDFAVTGTDVTWTGGDDWGWRRCVLHYAHLAKAAGGVDAFVIGSEMVALNAVRSAPSVYPAVAEWKRLAADVKAILGPAVTLTYAADWSEWNGHTPADGSGDQHHHLDPLWADPAIGAVGIDAYWPLSDWRDGDAHADAALAASGHDRAYLEAQIEGGEAFDWYYADADGRAAQQRLPITDGAYGKPWVFRRKDIRNWWLNAHHDRPGGAEQPVPTAWVPQSKPVWLTEFGIPAIDKGASAPNLFVDAKSSESAWPPFSRGTRDDLIQRRALEAFYAWWQAPGRNPVSSVYGGAMLDLENAAVWCWDARPFPEFPALGGVWGDAPNWATGHWLNGRLGRVPAGALIAAICARSGLTGIDTSGAAGLVTGYVIGHTMSAREALEPLLLALHADAVESGGVLRIVAAAGGAATPLAADETVLDPGHAAPGAAITRRQESELPQAARVTYVDADAGYRQAVAESRRLGGTSRRVAEASLPMVLSHGEAAGLAERLLHDAWAAREEAALLLPPSALALDAGDAVTITQGGRTLRLRITGITDGSSRAIAALACEPTVYQPFDGPPRDGHAPAPPVPGRPLVIWLDLPDLSGEGRFVLHAAGRARPWPGAILLEKGLAPGSFTVAGRLTQPAAVARLAAPFWPGPLHRWDRVNAIAIEGATGLFASASDEAVLAGANALAIEAEPGLWEVVQFAEAALEAPGRWRLTRLLRGQAGTEDAMRAPVPAGARVVALDSAVAALPLLLDERGLTCEWRASPLGTPPGGTLSRVETPLPPGRSLRPLSPCAFRARWQPDGAIALSWVRRTRVAGDCWEGEVPLGEAAERYDCEIVSGQTVLRKFEGLTFPACTWSLADQLADCGQQQWAVSARVYQLSDVAGRGTPLAITAYF